MSLKPNGDCKNKIEKGIMVYEVHKIRTLGFRRINMKALYEKMFTEKENENFFTKPNF